MVFLFITYVNIIRNSIEENIREYIIIIITYNNKKLN